jgi:hypothetical protein
VFWRGGVDAMEGRNSGSSCEVFGEINSAVMNLMKEWLQRVNKVRISSVPSLTPGEPFVTTECSINKQISNESIRFPRRSTAGESEITLHNE